MPVPSASGRSACRRLRGSCFVIKSASRQARKIRASPIAAGSAWIQQDLACGGQPAEQSGYQHAAEEKRLDREAGAAQRESPDQSCREKAVVQALVGRQCLGLLRIIRRDAKRTRPDGRVQRNISSTRNQTCSRAIRAITMLAARCIDKCPRQVRPARRAWERSVAVAFGHRKPLMSGAVVSRWP